MIECELKKDGEGNFSLIGQMEFNTVAWLLKKSSREFAGNDSITLDLNQVTSVDSAGLALLLRWIANARHGSVQISFLNIPEKLLSIARISDVDGLLVNQNSSSISSSSNSSSR